VRPNAIQEPSSGSQRSQVRTQKQTENLAISGLFHDSLQPWQTALRGSLEVFDLAHPAGQWVPSGENLGHQILIPSFNRRK
jgi:hypothetical protein